MSRVDLFARIASSEQGRITLGAALVQLLVIIIFALGGIYVQDGSFVVVLFVVAALLAVFLLARFLGYFSVIDDIHRNSLARTLASLLGAEIKPYEVGMWGGAKKPAYGLDWTDGARSLRLDIGPTNVVFKTKVKRAAPKFEVTLKKNGELEKTGDGHAADRFLDQDAQSSLESIRRLNREEFVSFRSDKGFSVYLPGELGAKQLLTLVEMATPLFEKGDKI
ncbi:MAG: hypothetical protein OEV28_13735 [Nitrospirota bacterium]|nr:hypothetical protein [Nitrospirota bacterium]